MFKVNLTYNSTINYTNILPHLALPRIPWALLILYNFLILCSGVLGNATVLFLSLRYHALKLDKVTLVFVHSLAVCDIALCVLLFVPMMATLVSGRWVLGEMVCWVTGFFFSAPIIHEVLTVLSISGKCSDSGAIPKHSLN